MSIYELYQKDCIEFTMGSGRKFIGNKIDEKYFNIASERIKNANKELKMFY